MKHQKRVQTLINFFEVQLAAPSKKYTTKQDISRPFQ